MSSFLLVMLLGIGNYNMYYANLHGHSSYSDGARLPKDAFVYARDTARIDIQAITDHGEFLKNNQWQDIRAQADSAYEPGRFVALAGFEWTSYDYGHVNVYSTAHYANRYWCSPERFLFDWMSRDSTGFGQFNHPSLWSFKDFPYDSAGDREMALFEMQSKADARWYPVALDSGWHVGMTSNQDNHEADWGRLDHRTGVFAESLTRSSVLAALQARRTFGTLDRNLRLEFRANGFWMGSTVKNGALKFEILAADPDSSDSIQRVELVTDRNRVLDSLLTNANRVVWQPLARTDSLEHRYFFVRVIEQDGDLAISSPVWTR